MEFLPALPAEAWLIVGFALRLRTLASLTLILARFLSLMPQIASAAPTAGARGPRPWAVSGATVALIVKIVLP